MTTMRPTLLLTLAGVVTGSLAQEVDNHSYQHTPAPLECDLYIAESTLPNAGLGIFTTVPKEKGDTIGNGDVCLPFIDFWFNNDQKSGFFYPFSDYVWNGNEMGMSTEVDSDDVEAYWPGLDCMVNCNLALLNVKKAEPIYDEGGLHRSIHPGAGAISPYHNGTTFVKRHIPAGGELFKYYGDDWFVTRPSTFGNVPLLYDYTDAKYILNEFADVADAKAQPGLYDTLVGLRDIWDSRTTNALPDTYEDAQKILKTQDMGVLHQPDATRSVEWIRQNGKCIDHIVPGQSTIDGAGHGAFAKRDIPVGTTITGSPLHHVPTKRLFHMYEYRETKKGKHKRTAEKIGEQVAVNYCFGHEDSTMLLCPYGAGINYINHNQTLANVKIQWAENGSTGHNSDWLSLPPELMMYNYAPSLSFDYIATKPIKEGEELFLDYGQAWEAAWQQHVDNWKPPEHWKDYVSSVQFNQLYGSEAIRTDEEQMEDPYPNNLQIRCHYKLTEDHWKQQWMQESDLKNYLSWTNDEKGYPCSILERKVVRKRKNGRPQQQQQQEQESPSPDDYRYDVIMYIIEDDAETFEIEEEIEVYGVPREGLSFVDIPYSTDLHLLNTFRQPIGIPEDMMPQVWKNRLEETPSFLVEMER